MTKEEYEDFCGVCRDITTHCLDGFCEGCQNFKEDQEKIIKEMAEEEYEIEQELIDWAAECEPE
jgi:hypothetical protein